MTRTEALLRYVLSRHNSQNLVQIHESALAEDLTRTVDRKEFTKLYDVPMVARKKMFGDRSISIQDGVYTLLDEPHGYDRTVAFEPEIRNDGPTLEEYSARGYQAETYPPQGYKEKPSPGLTKFRAEQEAKDKAAAEQEAARAIAEFAKSEEFKKALDDMPKTDGPVATGSSEIPKDIDAVKTGGKTVPDFDLADLEAAPLKTPEEVVRELNAMTKAQLVEAAVALGEKPEPELSRMNKAALVAYLAEKVTKR